ncbi:hypothetical protein SAMN05421890_4906 [Ensifer adhaerens]|nr:hypothetical protein SAMN05421890_4906 [Ensifer adhaerens]
MLSFFHRNSYIRRHLRYLGYQLGILKLKPKPLAAGEKRGLSRKLPRKFISQ